jgi:hypothetical protein
MTSTRRLAVVATVLTVVAVSGLGPASSSGAPANGANSFIPIYVCNGQVLTVLTASGNTAWEVSTVGDLAGTPAHLRWFSLRIYDGEYASEPAIPPLVAFQKQYGERVGQGDSIRCTGQNVKPGQGGGLITVFLDLDFVRLQ